MIVKVGQGLPTITCLLKTIGRIGAICLSRYSVWTASYGSGRCPENRDGVWTVSGRCPMDRDAVLRIGNDLKMPIESRLSPDCVQIVPNVSVHCPVTVGTLSGCCLDAVWTDRIRFGLKTGYSGLIRLKTENNCHESQDLVPTFDKFESGMSY